MHTKPELTTINSFLVAGLAARTSNHDESKPSTAKIPTLWQQVYASQILQAPSPAIGVYCDYEPDDQGYYTLTAGTEVPSPIATLNTIEVAAGDYLVFRHQGPQPQAIITLWKAVWSFFKTNTQYRRLYQTDFELYKDPICEIYIGI